MPAPARPSVPVNPKRIEQDLLELVNSHERVIHILWTALGMVFIAGIGIVWGLIPCFQERASIVLALVASFWVFMATGLTGNGMVGAMVSRAASRFNARFPRNSQERPIALGILAGMTSPFHLAEKLQAALDVPLGSQAAAEDQVQKALEKLGPPPSAGRTTAAAPAAVPPQRPASPGSSGEFIPLDVHHPPQPTGPDEGEAGEAPRVPLQPLERAEVVQTPGDGRDLRGTTGEAHGEGRR